MYECFMRLILFSLFFLGSSLPALAQENKALLDAQTRTQLARDFHEVRPLNEQINRAIDKAARRVPKGQRAAFINQVKRLMDYKAITQHSINAMAEVFTADELQAMIDYYSSSEGRSIREKMPEYRDRLGPEITEMMDKALMELRTGRSSP